MKVLKEGRAQKGWATEATCTGAGNGGGGCSALLLVEQGDLFQTSHTDYGGDTDYYTTFKCQQCGVLTDLKDVPGNIRSGLPTMRAWEQRGLVGDFR